MSSQPPQHDPATLRLLQDAYQHIKSGERVAAQQLLRPLLKAQPHNTDAWWLLANSFTDPKRRAQALQHILTLDPDHTQAQKSLQRLATAPPPPAAPADKKRGPGRLLALVGMLVVGVGVAVGMRLNGGDTANVDDANVHSVTLAPQQTASALAAQPEAGVAPATADAADATPAATHTPTTTLPPTPSRTPRATLPPAIIPTATIPATVVTNTPRPTLRLPPSSTPVLLPPGGAVSEGPAGPAGGGAAPAVGSDYWYGYDRNMSDQQQNGRFYRFYKFPVRVWVGPTPNPNWQRYVDNALRQIGQVVPITRTSNEADADLILYFAPRAEYDELCPAGTLGCAALTFDLATSSFEGRVRYTGFAYIAHDQPTDMAAQVVILHELLHAVGVDVHSQDPRDIMYYQYGIFGDRSNALMSERDFNTLQRLYNSPAFGDG